MAATEKEATPLEKIRNKQSYLFNRLSDINSRVNALGTKLVDETSKEKTMVKEEESLYQEGTIGYMQNLLDETEKTIISIEQGIIKLENTI